MKKNLIFIHILFLSLAFCEKSLPEFVSTCVEEIKTELELIRTQPQDMSLESVWEIPLCLKIVTDTIKSPVENIGNYSESVYKISTGSIEDIVEVVKKFYNISEEKKDKSLHFEKKFYLPKNIPNRILPELKKLLTTIHFSSLVLKQYCTTVDKKTKQDIYKFYIEAQYQSTLSPNEKKEMFKKFEHLPIENLLFAFNSIINSLSRWGSIGEIKEKFGMIKWNTEIGKVLISDCRDNVYTEDILKDVTLLIDFGGENTYNCRVAGAKENEIKIVIDYGEKIVVRSSEPITCGSGLFGLGVFYIPNKCSVVEIYTGKFSLGSALCGAGLFYNKGSGQVISEDYSQGAGVLGVGIFISESSHTFYEPGKYSQGFGGTYGIGIFRHQGDNTKFRAGFRDPDPRDEFGATSFCQGAGLGLREYVGGGIGICVLKGDNLEVESSYFCQGVGYWYSAGIFYLEGNKNFLKTRRYCLGSGIHSAIGTFFLSGDENSIFNWGVGPGYGWDRGIAGVFIKGNRNIVSTEWGAMVSAINSRNFVYISGEENKLKLPSVASAGILHDVPDYSVVIINGQNYIQKPNLKSDLVVNDKIFISPWGILKLNNCILSNFSLPAIVWEKVPRETKSENLNLQEILSSTPTEKVRKLLNIASSFSIDKISPKKATSILSLLPEEEISYIYNELDENNVLEILRVRILTSIFSQKVIEKIVEEINSSSGKKKAVLIALLHLKSPSKVIPLLLELIEKEKDLRIKSACLRTLGHIYNEKVNYTTPRVEIIKMLLKYLKTRRLEKKLIDKFTNLPNYEILSVISLIEDFTEEERVYITENFPEDISWGLDKKVIEYLLSRFKGKENESYQKLCNELKFIESYKPVIRKKVKEIIDKHTYRPLINACIFLLGNIGEKEDLNLISSYLYNGHSITREIAIAAVGRFADREFIEGLITSQEENIKKLGLLTLYHIPENKKNLLNLIDYGMKSDNLTKKFVLSIANSSKVFKESGKYKKLKLKGKKDKSLTPQLLFIE